MSPSSTRFQTGSLERTPSREGLAWFIRFRRPEGFGGPLRPRFFVGLVKDLPTKKAAKLAADDLRREFNRGHLAVKSRFKFSEVIRKYEREECPARYSTAKGYKGKIRKHIEPRWGGCYIDEIKAKDVRDWLTNLPLATKTQGHLRDIMRSLFRFAMLWEWMPAGPNPMSLFQLKGSSKRRKQIVIFSHAELRRIMNHPLIAEEPYATMVKLAMALGITCSEVCGLQWRDIDWMRGEIQINRGVVDGHVDDVKTEHRSKPLPLDPIVARLLREHRMRSTFTAETDFLFASPNTGGERPLYAQHIQEKRIRPVVQGEMGFPAGTGWHALRHSYRALLGDLGTPVGVQKDLLRHADIATTMNTYGGSYVDSLRHANGAVVNLLFGTETISGPSVAQEAEKCQ